MRSDGINDKVERLYGDRYKSWWEFRKIKQNVFISNVLGLEKINAFLSNVANIHGVCYCFLPFLGFQFSDDQTDLGRHDNITIIINNNNNKS